MQSRKFRTGRSNKGLDALVVEHLSKISVRLRLSAEGRDALFETRLVDLAHSRHVDVTLILEIVAVLTPDEAVKPT